MPDDFAALVQQASGVVSLSDPAKDALALTASNTITFNPTRGVFVANAGTLVVDFAYPNEGGVSITLANVTAGTIYPLRITRVYAASSSSIGLVGLY